MNSCWLAHVSAGWAVYSDVIVAALCWNALAGGILVHPTVPPCRPTQQLSLLCASPLLHLAICAGRVATCISTICTSTVTNNKFVLHHDGLFMRCSMDKHGHGFHVLLISAQKGQSTCTLSALNGRYKLIAPAYSKALVGSDSGVAPPSLQVPA